MDKSKEFKAARADFLRSQDFADFFMPILASRRQMHIDKYISKGGDEPRLRIRELEEIEADIEFTINIQ